MGSGTWLVFSNSVKMQSSRFWAYSTVITMTYTKKLFLSFFSLVIGLSVTYSTKIGSGSNIPLDSPEAKEILTVLEHE